MNEALLSIHGLTVSYVQHHELRTAVNKVSLELQKGECLALVGESGCGKSTLALAVIGLLPKNESRIPQGTIHFDGKNILANNEEDWQKIRGRRIAMVFQDPFSSLNPVLTIGYQLEEVASKNAVLELLSQVQIKDPERIVRSYPHQVSGGQRQRVMIAMALAQKPDLLIADEPTTALDVTVQDEIIKLLKRLQLETNMGMIFVTHNLGLVKNVADRVAVMKKGEIVETGPTAQILSKPNQPYTNGLLRCMPTLTKTKGPLPTLEEVS